ncbi:MAG TPA: hypothetical protein VGF94_09375 [Kofleriaceae bacterium]|jgi:hypothetical protein
MGARSAMIMAALAACSSPPGVARISIALPATTPPIESVSMFVGTGDATPVGIGPAGYQDELSGILAWPLDDSAPFAVDAVTSDHVVFELQHGVAADDVAVAIAVADAAQGNHVAAGYLDSGLAIPETGVADFTLVLETDLAVEVWGPPASAPAPTGTCVYLTDAAANTQEMIVAADDPDCDGYAGSADRCDDHVYLARRGVPIEQATCDLAETFMDATDQPVLGCVIGGEVCHDETGPITGCIGGTYCVPRRACDNCGYGPSGLACLLDPSMPTSESTIVCPVEVVAGQACPQPQRFTAPALIASHVCVRGPMIYDIQSASWGTSVHTTGFAATIDNTNGNCDFDVTATGQLDGLLTITTLVAADLGDGHGIAIPITFVGDPNPVCPPPDCTYLPVAGDGVAACLGSPSPL